MSPLPGDGLLHCARPARRCQAGHAVYDFLAGVGRYKQSLATDASELVWLRVQRPRARFAIEDRVQDWPHALAR